MYAPILLPQAEPRSATSETDGATPQDWRTRWRQAAGPASAAPLPRVVTWLAPVERARVSLALGDSAIIDHRDAIEAVRSDLNADAADTVLVSANDVRLSDLARLARLVCGFPSVPVFGVASDASGADSLNGALLLGRAGVSAVFDCASAFGLASLRAALAPRRLPDAFQRSCVSSILAAIDAESVDLERERPSTSGLARFFAAVFAPAAIAKQVAASLGVRPTTLSSRFHRAALPSVRQYIAWARLVWAARLGETPGLSLSAIAFRLDASSPQSFGRALRTLTGLSPAEFRRAFDGAAMLERYRETLIAPYREILRAFDPLGIERRQKREGEAGRLLIGRAA